MVFTDKIKMKEGYYYSDNQQEIDELHLKGTLFGWFKKEDIYNYIKYNNGVVYVDIYPNPELIPAVSKNGEKYVKSVADDTYKDNLMSLPRE